MKNRIIAAALAVLSAGVSCTVKEDRGPCPCQLQVSFSDPDLSGTAALTGWREGLLFREKVRIEKARPYWAKSVEKGFLVLSACKGADKASLDGHQVRIPAGAQADSLYACFRAVDATGDLAPVEVTLRKQFATVLLDIRKSAETVSRCRFLVEGNSCGFDLLDFAPVPGPFRFEPEARPGEGIVSLRVPRQSDDALSVTIRPGNGIPVRFPLGAYIARLGYNWKAEELQDVYVAIDLVAGTVEVRVADWEAGEEFPLVAI